MREKKEMVNILRTEVYPFLAQQFNCFQGCLLCLYPDKTVNAYLDTSLPGECFWSGSSSLLAPSAVDLTEPREATREKESSKEKIAKFFRVGEGELGDKVGEMAGPYQEIIISRDSV